MDRYFGVVQHLPDAIYHVERVIPHAQNPERKRVAALWHDWKQRGIVRQEALPAFYAYAQTYTRFGQAQPATRMGIIGLLRVNQPGAPFELLPHEDVLADRIESRLQYHLACPLMPAPVHALYADPTQSLVSILRQALQRPYMEVMDQNGVRNTLGIIQHPELIHQLREFLENQPLYLADGHHRWTVARKAAAYPAHAEPWLPVWLTNLHDGQERIWPTHRSVTVGNSFPFRAFLEKLGRLFDIREANCRQPVHEQLQDQTVPTFALAYHNDCVLVSPMQPEALDQLLPAALHPSVRRLLYTLVDELVLNQFVQPYLEPGTKPVLNYHHYYPEAYEQTQHGRLVAILNEVALESLVEVAQAGATMPAKTTHFWPKVLAGLVFSDLSPGLFDSLPDQLFEPQPDLNSHSYA